MAKRSKQVPSTQALTGIQEEEVEVEVQVSRCSRLEGIVQGSGMQQGGTPAHVLSDLRNEQEE